MRRPTLATFVALGLAATVAVVVVLAPFASSAPDGLERVAIDQGFDDTADDHALASGPLADYGDGSRGGTVVAGLAGVGLTFALATGAAVVLRRRRS